MEKTLLQFLCDVTKSVGSKKAYYLSVIFSKVFKVKQNLITHPINKQKISSCLRQLTHLVVLAQLTNYARPGRAL